MTWLLVMSRPPQPPTHHALFPVIGMQLSAALHANSPQIHRSKRERDGWIYKKGKLINIMTHSFCGNHFLTAFIEANQIISAQ